MISTHALNTPLVNVQLSLDRNGNPIAPYQNGWTNFGNPQWGGFWKQADGIVHLRGMIAGGKAGTTIFTLPLGYRLGAMERFACACYPGGVLGNNSDIPPQNVTATGTDQVTGAPVRVTGSIPGIRVPPAFGMTWVDVNPDGTVGCWQDCVTQGYFVSLSGILFFGDH